MTVGTFNLLELLNILGHRARRAAPRLACLGVLAVPCGASAMVIESDDDGNAVIVKSISDENVPENKFPAGPKQVKSKSGNAAALQPRRLPKLRASQSEYYKLAAETAWRHSGSDGVTAAGLDAISFVDLFTSLIHKESRFDPNALSPKGAMGLGQLMPGTAKDLGVGNAFQPEANLEASASYFTGLLQDFKSADLALAAYNAGPQAVRKYGGIPPYKETRQYVADISFAAGVQRSISAAEGAAPAEKTETKQVVADLKDSGVQPADYQKLDGDVQLKGGQSVWEY
jgi:Transglycosylase SLT domain